MLVNAFLISFTFFRAALTGCNSIEACTIRPLIGEDCMSQFRKRDLYEWCKIPARKLPDHPRRRVPFRMVRDSSEMGQLMAAELVEIIEANLPAQGR